MITLLSKIFIPNHTDLKDATVRRAYGMLCGLCGIVLNLFLFAVKFFAGTLTGSIAITADAFNNLADAGSSIITLFGFRLAGQKPDPEHPFGHGRMEYLSGLFVSLLIILMAVELLKNNFYHMVISDHKMPDMDGVELLQFVNVHHPDTVKILLWEGLEYITPLCKPLTVSL